MSTVVVDANDIQAQVSAAADAARPMETAEPEAEQGTPEAKSEPKAEPKSEAQPELTEKERIAEAKVQARLAEITRQKHEAQREAEHYKKLHEQAKQAQAQQAPETPAGPPKPDEYPTYDDYIEALTEYKADQLIARRLKERDENARIEAQRREAYAQQDVKLKAWTEREKQVLTTLPDYQEVMQAAENIDIPHHLVQIIFESDIGPQVAYHLAKNPELTGEISALDPLSAARAIGRLERQLQSETPPPPNPVPSAPPPLPKLRGATGVRVEKHPDDMTQAEFNAWREKKLERARG